jgi:hypothetical protein
MPRGPPSYCSDFPVNTLLVIDYRLRLRPGISMRSVRHSGNSPCRAVRSPDQSLVRREWTKTKRNFSGRVGYALDQMGWYLALRAFPVASGGRLKTVPPRRRSFPAKEQPPADDDFRRQRYGWKMIRAVRNGSISPKCLMCPTPYSQNALGLTVQRRTTEASRPLLV